MIRQLGSRHMNEVPPRPRLEGTGGAECLKLWRVLVRHLCSVT